MRLSQTPTLARDNEIRKFIDSIVVAKIARPVIGRAGSGPLALHELAGQSTNCRL